MSKPVFEVHYTLPPDLPYPWCSAYGEDRYGIWVEFTVRYGEKKDRKVKQRMRWIHPGRFTMGSPEEEAERNKNEKQHEVTLANGFWLADTACTQELWEAVMGENPSDFKGLQRPVDNVNWDDCQQFIKKINSLPVLEDLSLCLPTESQWEYACRAETLTPFHFGENITTKLVNYDGNYPYGNGEKGEYREQTVDVKSFPPNNWGLFEMHGNVREWCKDWLGDYSNKVEIDPIGPEEGKDHVLRGGSWIVNAEYCRSAVRDTFLPDDHLNGIGFRLSRCQQIQNIVDGVSAIRQLQPSKQDSNDPHNKFNRMLNLTKKCNAAFESAMKGNLIDSEKKDRISNELDEIIIYVKGNKDEVKRSSGVVDIERYIREADMARRKMLDLPNDYHNLNEEARILFLIGLGYSNQKIYDETGIGLNEIYQVCIVNHIPIIRDN